MAEQNDNIEDEGVTLGQIFRAMFHNKIRLLIVGITTLIVVFIFITLGYNKNSKTYVAKFKYSDINIANGHYSDGSPFNTLDLVNLLEDVKNSNEVKYSNVDVDKIVAHNAMTITEEITVNKAEDEKEETEYITSHYTLIFAAKYFPDYNTAKSFIIDLINYPILKSNSMVSEIVFDENLTLFDSSNIYSSQINYLTNQENMILSGYESLISTYGDLVIDGKKLSSRVSEINLYFNNNQLAMLSDEVQQNGYIKDLDGYRNTLETQKYNLTLELKSNQAKLDQLIDDRNSLIEKATSTSSLQTLDLSTYNNAIITLTQRNVDINQEIEVIDRYLNSSETYTPELKANFEARLTSFRTKLAELTTDYKNCYLKAIENYNVYYNDASKVVGTGGLSITVSFALSVLAGLVVACIVNLCFDHKMLSKEYLTQNKKKNIVNETK